MTDQERKPGAAWDLVEDLLAEEEIERQRAMPAEERHAAMKAQGLDPDRAHAAADEVLKKLGLGTVTADAPATGTATAPAPTKIVSLAAEREKRRRPTWVLALVAAAALAVLAGGGGGIVALNSPTPSSTTPAPPIPTAPPGPSPEELARLERVKQAQALRATAKNDCAEGNWDKCGEGLGAARGLDPLGDGARGVQRLHGKVDRALAQRNLASKLAPAPRKLSPEQSAKLVASLAAWKGQAVRLVCVRDVEPGHVCAQLATALKSGGWAVTRVDVALDAGSFDYFQMLVEVATDADESTQAAADGLVDGLGGALLFARGPDDMAPGGDAPLRLTIGKQ